MTQDQAEKIVMLIKEIIRNETQDVGDSGIGYNWGAEILLQDLLVEATQSDPISNHK